MDVKDSNLFCLTDCMESKEAHSGPLYQMGSLIAGLPFKRGLSKFYGGKSQSFSSLEEVKCVEHLAKPEYSNCRRKKHKGCYECGLKHCKSYEPRISSASMISKRPHKTAVKRIPLFYLKKESNTVALNK